MRYPLIKKVLMIGVIASLLMIPLSMIDGVVHERSSYRGEARYSIAQSWTAEQQLLGPLLVIPYKERFEEKVWDKRLKRYELKERSADKQLIIAPTELTLDGVVATEMRQRGIYAIPVYRSRLALAGRFDLHKMDEVVSASEHSVEWQPAYLSVVVSDVRGVVRQPVLTWGGETREFAPDTHIRDMRNGMHAPLGRLQVQKEMVGFNFDLLLNGMERLSFSPVGKSTSVKLKADWPNPSFFGRYLPASRDIDTEGFIATWNLSSFSSEIHQHLATCQEGNCAALMQEAFGVRLFNSVDIYQQSERSVKYALLFIVITFVSFFLYEVMKGLRLHPMQYLLVGLGLSIFYLLLISLSEHMAFAYAYSIATIASTLLIGFYISSVLGSVKHGVAIGGALVLLYGLLYGILSSEDNSLLMGSILLFGLLGLVMTVTRRLDWYTLADKMATKIAASKVENGDDKKVA